MRRVAAAFAAVAVATAFALPVQSQSAVLIRGRVVSAETGDPLVHARVVIFNDATPLPAIFSDAQGQFSSAPLPQGRYRLTVTKAGFALTSVARLPADGVTVRMPRSAADRGTCGRSLRRAGCGRPAAAVNASARSDEARRADQDDEHGRPRRVSIWRPLGRRLRRGAQRCSRRMAPDYSIDRCCTTPALRRSPTRRTLIVRPGEEKLGVDFGSDAAVADRRQSGIVFVGPDGLRLPRRRSPAPASFRAASRAPTGFRSFGPRFRLRCL